MNALMVLLATTALGIEVGWEPLPGGGHEYTLQLDPQTLKVLETGQEEIFSEVHNGVDIRRYRIVVGVGKLRRDYGPLAAEIEPPPAVTAAPTPQVAAPQASPLNHPAAGMPAAAPVADPYQVPASETPANSPPATDLETIPPAATAPDFGLPGSGAVEPGTPGVTPESTIRTAPEATAPADDLWHNSAEQPAAEGNADQITIDSAAAAKMAQAPGKLPESKDASAPIRATFEDGKEGSASEVVDTAKPTLPKTEPQAQPWAPLVVSIVLLACSLGGNIFLGWIAADARARYRNAVAKIRGAAA